MSKPPLTWKDVETRIALHPWHNQMIAVCRMDERRQEIITKKPPNEIPIRLRLFRALTEEEIAALPVVVREARDKVQEAWDKARKALAQSIQAHPEEMQAWHAKYCGCKEWNGKEIVFPEEK